MSEKLPTLANTYFKSTKLYVRTFIDVLPFILLLMLSKFMLEKAWPNEPIITFNFFLRIMVDSAISALFFSIILYTMYQKHYNQPVHFLDIFTKGSLRFIQVFLAYMFISLPLLFAFLLIKIDIMLWQPYVITPAFIEQQRWLSLGILGTGLFITLILAIFSFVAGIYIVNKNENAISGIRQSFKMVQSYWIDSFLIVALFGIITITISMLLDDYHVPLANEILILFMSSFYPALMIIHDENMVKIIHTSVAITPLAEKSVKAI